MYFEQLIKQFKLEKYTYLFNIIDVMKLMKLFKFSFFSESHFFDIMTLV